LRTRRSASGAAATFSSKIAIRWIARLNRSPLIPTLNVMLTAVTPEALMSRSS
jgi:hypothetical protein